MTSQKHRPSFNHYVPVEGTKATVADKVKRDMEGLLHYKDVIEESLAFNDHSHTFDHVCLMILGGRLELHLFDRCCIIMEVQQFPLYKTYHCFIACGDKEAIFELQDEFIQKARDRGCKYITLSGRQGWMREWGKRGWRHACTTMKLEVGDG